MTPLRQCLTLGVGCLWLVLTPSTARSWEADMHYGLVKWLAYKAGFSLNDSEILAAGSESADESNVLSATAVMTSTGCRGTEASRHVQQHHFPSGGYVPSLPKKRTVYPGHYSKENNGNRWVRQEILVSGNAINRKTRLDRFGASLHPLADSWAHQGESDTVSACPDDRFWGHPAARGGISLSPFAKHNHDADLTYKFPEEDKLLRDATEAAESLYAFMKKFLDKNSHFVNREPEEWEKLTDDVEKFARAEKAYAANDDSTKQAWFESHNDVWDTFTTYPCFLQTLNLEGAQDADCSPAKDKKFAEVEKESRGNQPAIDSRVPDPVRDLMQRFLTTWIIGEKSIDAIINDFVDVNLVTRELAEPILANINAAPENLRERKDVRAVEQSLRRAREEPGPWMRAMLGIWFARDHGLVNAWGHGMPNDKGFAILVEQEFEPLGGFDRLADAIQVPGLPITYLLAPVEPAERGERYLTTFAFRHAPRDAIMLVVERIGSDWKISGFYWLVT